MLKAGGQKAKGFTLIEILVASIILAIGLLGLASMQTLALKDNQDAFFYAQASSLAYEMSDRIKVNAAAWQGAIPTPLAACTNSCNSVANTCSPGQMASYDYCAWRTNLTQRIGSGVNGDVAIKSAGTDVCGSGSVGGAGKRCITISWTRNSPLGGGATNQFQLEMTP